MMDVITKTVAQEVSREADTSKESTIDLEKRYRAAVAYLEEATTSVQPMWIEMLKQQQKTLEDVRIWRMAMESELRISERAVGGFFGLITDSFKESLVLMREFVDVAERLKKLNESGFLDKICEIKSRQQSDARAD